MLAALAVLGFSKGVNTLEFIEIPSPYGTICVPKDRLHILYDAIEEGFQPSGDLSFLETIKKVLKPERIPITKDTTISWESYAPVQNDGETVTTETTVEASFLGIKIKIHRKKTKPAAPPPQQPPAPAPNAEEMETKTIDIRAVKINDKYYVLPTYTEGKFDNLIAQIASGKAIIA